MNNNFFTTTDPFTGRSLETYDILQQSEVSALLDSQHQVNTHFAGIPFEDRVRYLTNLADMLSQTRDEMARSITCEMGKPISQSYAEVDKCIWLCRYASEDLSRSYATDGRLDLGETKVIMRHAPLGTILGIMPWNFPIWQTLRFAVPAILNGNPVLLKPAPNVIGSSLLLEKCVQEACGDEGAFRLVLVETETVEAFIAHDAVAAVTLTGSTRAGKAVASLAGKYLKPSVLELGGSDPFIVLEDARLEQAAKAYIDSRMNNTGQTCIAAKRAIIHHSVFQQFADIAVHELMSKEVSKPFNANCEISCIARSDLSEVLENQILKSHKGVTSCVDCVRRDDSNVFSPGLYVVEDESVPLWCEEIFGPVGVMVRVHSMEEAVMKANDSRYGLGCSIWTDNMNYAEQTADRIHAGSIHINRMVSSDPRVPFGGVGDSGYGRELGLAGFRELTNLKTITYPVDS